MAVCGHQFRGGDESDWILSASVGCLDGSTTASRILQELFKKHCHRMSAKPQKEKPKTVSTPPITSFLPKPEPELKKPERSPPKEVVIHKIPHSFENFDESQHLSGCPMKWLYEKKLYEKSKPLKTARFCSKNSAKKTEVRREKRKNLRDKTPVEVKIHKINLIEKYTRDCDELYPQYTPFPTGNPKAKELETRRKNLAAKLNWKLYDESQDDCSFETSSEIGFRHNYFPPRPLLGLKPLLSILLASQQETNCCSLVPQLQSATPRRPKTEASLSIQSLNLPVSPPKEKPRPKTTTDLRWGAKSRVHVKKLQIPNQITLRLDQKKRETDEDLTAVGSNPSTKKVSRRAKSQTKSLSSLFYELKGKTSHRHNHHEECLHEMIMNLTTEGQFKMKRFFNIDFEPSETIQGCRKPEKGESQPEENSEDNELHLICGKARFYKKKSKSGKQPSNLQKNP